MNNNNKNNDNLFDNPNYFIGGTTGMSTNNNISNGNYPVTSSSPLPPSSSSTKPSNPMSNNITSSSPINTKISSKNSNNNNTNNNNFVSGSMKQGGALDTLDEPVSATLMRDLKAIWKKLKQVLFPLQNKQNILRDWDLWGPLVLCLVLSIRLSLTAPDDQASRVFAGVFVIVWCGAGVVTLNSKLLGGKLSFFQSVCVLGYCIFPLVVSSIVSLFVKWILVRGIICSIAFAWSIYASVGFLVDVQLNKRRILALYPMFLFYFAISWMILISKSMLESS